MSNAFWLGRFFGIDTHFDLEVYHNRDKFCSGTYVFPSFLKLAEVFSRDGMSFLASCQNLVPRPWVIDDLDTFKAKWGKKSWKKASPYTMNLT